VSLAKLRLGKELVEGDGNKFGREADDGEVKEALGSRRAFRVGVEDGEGERSRRPIGRRVELGRLIGRG
jgi:hypothetical protein